MLLIARSFAPCRACGTLYDALSVVVWSRLETVDLRSFGRRPSAVICCLKQYICTVGRILHFYGRDEAQMPPRKSTTCRAARQPILGVYRHSRGAAAPAVPTPTPPAIGLRVRSSPAPKVQGNLGVRPARVTDLAASRCSLSARTANMETLRTATERPDFVTTT